MPRFAIRTDAHARERGFTIVEMIVAMLILAILIAAAMKAFGGAKKATYAQEGKTVGSAYMQALSQYHADFANRHPPATGATGWGTATAARGPVGLTGQPYMRSAPEAVTLGRSGVSVNVAGNCNTSSTPASPAGSGAGHTSWVAVCYLAPEPRFFVKVSARKAAGAPWTLAGGASVCFMGATPATPKC